MQVLFDASALYKRYSGERGAERVLQLQAGAKAVCAAVHCKVELAAALTRQWREGLFDDAEYQRTLQAIDDDFASLTVMPLSAQAESASMAAMRMSLLRGTDALHIGTAKAADVDLFVTADKRQAVAARAIGLNTELIDA